MKNMSNEANEKEESLLKALFSNIAKQLSNAFDTTVSKITTKGFLKKHWENVFNSQEQLKVLDIIEKKLNIKSFNAGDSSCYASLVYKIRNTIVHSKDTELHITDSYLNNTIDGELIKRLIEDFLILTLENVCFELLTNVSDDNIVRYSSTASATKFSEVLRNQIL